MSSFWHGTKAVVLAALLTAGAACGDDTVDEDDGTGGTGGSSTTSSTSSGAGQGGATSTSTTSGAGGMGACEVPTTVAELQTFLASGAYQNWTAESAVHGSTGPHFGDVRTFVNDDLFDSLDAFNTTHPVCSASVKELYGQGGNAVRGYSVMVKVTDGSGGDSWYWYEDYDGSVVAEGVGNGTCTGCHGSGTDFFRSPFPLQ